MVIFIEGDERLANLSCANSHSYLDKVFNTMAGALFNAFTSNYSKDVNSEIHMKRKSEESGIATRDRNTDKKKILSCSKK